jgi:hypothetical protein
MLDPPGLGGSADYAIIYKQPGQQRFNWAKEFPDGYSCGARAESFTDKLEGFKPVSCERLKIIVDELANIRFVQWT